MTQPLNIYGDDLIHTSGRHGADISSQRIDDLDVAALLYAIRERHRPGVAIDLGCGIGIPGLRFAVLGFTTILLDRIPIEQTVLRVSGLDQLLPLSYLMKDAITLDEADLPNELVLCYSQRFIHYGSYTTMIRRMSSNACTDHSKPSTRLTPRLTSRAGATLAIGA